MKSIDLVLAFSLTLMAMTIVGLIVAVFIQSQTNQNLSNRVKSLETELQYSENRIVQIIDENDKELKATKRDVKFFKDMCNKYYENNDKLLDKQRQWIEERQKNISTLLHSK